MSNATGPNTRTQEEGDAGQTKVYNPTIEMADFAVESLPTTIHRQHL